MSLPSTITVNVGSPAADIVFDDVSKISGSSVVFTAASPQGDLKGRPSLRFSHEKSKAGLVRSLESAIIQVYDNETGVYRGFIKADITLNRSETVPVQMAVDAMDILLESMGQASVKEAFVNALV